MKAEKNHSHPEQAIQPRHLVEPSNPGYLRFQLSKRHRKDGVNP
jgi:hypothetical protein